MRCSRLSPDKRRVQRPHIHRPLADAVLGQHLAVAEGTVLRSGFTTLAAPAMAFNSASSLSATASFSASSASRRLCSTVAEILSTSLLKAPWRSSSQLSVRSRGSSRPPAFCYRALFHVDSIPFFLVVAIGSRLSWIFRNVVSIC